jgi:malonyl-CoA O-methyltransferase
MIDRAISWIHRNQVPECGIIVHSRSPVCYPEVTGYFVPTLLQLGERGLAAQFGRWLATIQNADGSFSGPGGGPGFAFDTGQVLRGWVALLPSLPELEGPLRRACDWLIATSDPANGRLKVPTPGGAWSLGARGEVNEGIHLYVLAPLRAAARALGEKRYEQFVDKSLRYYLRHANLTDFRQRNALTHFFAYIQEALVELDCEDHARRGMAAAAVHQQDNGAVPGYADVSWVCSTGLAQLAMVWYHLGETDRAERALQFLQLLQNPGGGFFGSYGPGADYFPDAEIAWAVKYAIEACQLQITRHFDHTVDQYRPEIPETDGRVRAIASFLGDLEGRKVLDVGCGKGRYARLLQRRFPGANITGMDISPQMLAAVPAPIRRLRGSILNIPEPDGQYDAVLCVEALEHAVNISQGVKELIRVLKPGGRLVIIDKNAEKLGTLAMPHWEKWFRSGELLALLKAEGLDAQVNPVAYDGHAVPDGLFLCWQAVRKEHGTPSTRLN